MARRFYVSNPTALGVAVNVPLGAMTITPLAPVVTVSSGTSAPFDFFISPTGDDVLGAGTLASPWSLNAFNNTTCRTKYAGKRVGLLPGNGVYSSFTSNGVTTTIYAAMQVAGAWGIFQIQGGVTAAAPTYVAMCDASGNYSPRSSVIDCADPVTGNLPTQGSAFMGQMLDGSSSNPLPTNLGFVTIDGLHIRHFNYSALHFGFRTGELPNVIIQNCWLHDNWGTVRGGNPGCIHLNGTTGIQVLNNKIHGLRTAWRQPLPQVVQWQNSSGTALPNSIGATQAILASPWPYQTVVDATLPGTRSQGFINFSDGENSNNSILPAAGMYCTATYGSTLISWGLNGGTLTGNVSNTIQFSGINGPYEDSAIMFIGQFEDTRAGNYTIKNNTLYDCAQVIHLKDHLSTGTCEVSYNYIVFATMGVDQSGISPTSNGLEGIYFSGAAPGATLNIHHNLVATQCRNIGDAGVGVIGARNLGTVNCFNNTLSGGQGSVNAFETAGDASNPTGQFNCYDNLCWNPGGNTAGVGRWGFAQPTLSTPGFGTRVGNNVYNSGATFSVTNGTATVPSYTLAQMQAGSPGQVVEQGSINYTPNPFANGTGPVVNPADGGLLLSSWAISGAAQTAMLAMPDGVVCGAVDQGGNVVGGGIIGCNFSTALALGFSTPALLPNTPTGAAVSYPITPIGGSPPYTLSLVDVSANIKAASGTAAAPTPGNSWVFSGGKLSCAAPGATEIDYFLMKVVDNASATWYQYFSTSVAAALKPLVIASPSVLGNTQQGKIFFSTPLVVSGATGPVTWSIASQTGINSWAIGATLGTISGTPANLGTDTITVSVTDGVNTATAPFYITSNSSVTAAPRPAGNTGSGFFTLGTEMYDPNGKLFRPRGVNQNNYDKTDANRYAGLNGTVGINAVRLGMFFGATDAQHKTNVTSQHLNNHRAVIMQRFGNISTDTIQTTKVSNSSGSTSTALVKCMLQDWANAFSVWSPIQNSLLGLGIANEWGTNATTSSLFLGMYQAVIQPMASCASGVITLASSVTAATNPYALSKFAWFAPASGSAAQMVNILSTGGTPGAYTVTIDATTLTGTGGTLWGGAVGSMRGMGYTAPICIDASNFGQNASNITANAPAILASDPMQSVIFDFHVYGATINTTLAGLQGSASGFQGTGCFFIFGEMGIPGDADGTVLTTQQIVSTAEQFGIGWLQWAMDDNDLANGTADDGRWNCYYNPSTTIPQLPSAHTVLGKDCLMTPTYGALVNGQPATGI